VLLTRGADDCIMHLYMPPVVAAQQGWLQSDELQHFGISAPAARCFTLPLQRAVVRDLQAHMAEMRAHRRARSAQHSITLRAATRACTRQLLAWPCS
jgi:hypothetical protein